MENEKDKLEMEMRKSLEWRKEQAKKQEWWSDNIWTPWGERIGYAILIIVIWEISKPFLAAFVGWLNY